MPDKVKPALPPIPPDVAPRIRELTSRPEDRRDIEEGLAAIERGELGRVVRGLQQ
jgi:hypothetical protein